MNYIKITKNDIANGLGVRVVLWVSGCSCHCKGCHNPQTWSFNAGQLFTEQTKQEIFSALNHNYISGITFSGGHPLESNNLDTITELSKEIKNKFQNKTIWLYTGFSWENIKQYEIMKYIDVLVDGQFDVNKRDISLAWCGSSNQRVIDVQKSLISKNIVLFDSENKGVAKI